MWKQTVEEAVEEANNVFQGVYGSTSYVGPCLTLSGLFETGLIWVFFNPVGVGVGVCYCLCLVVGVAGAPPFFDALLAPSAPFGVRCILFC